MTVKRKWNFRSKPETIGMTEILVKLA